MTMTILTALGALITALMTGALVAPTEESAPRALSRAEWYGRATLQPPPFGPGR
jgi:hypothetical protein